MQEFVIMRITRSTLRKLIAEEYTRLLAEAHDADMGGHMSDDEHNDYLQQQHGHFTTPERMPGTPQHKARGAAAPAHASRADRHTDYGDYSEHDRLAQGFLAEDAEEEEEGQMDEGGDSDGNPKQLHIMYRGFRPVFIVTDVDANPHDEEAEDVTEQIAPAESNMSTPEYAKAIIDFITDESNGITYVFDEEMNDSETDDKFETADYVEHLEGLIASGEEEASSRGAEMYQRAGMSGEDEDLFESASEDEEEDDDSQGEEEDTVDLDQTDWSAAEVRAGRHAEGPYGGLESDTPEWHRQQRRRGGLPPRAFSDDTSGRGMYFRHSGEDVSMGYTDEEGAGDNLTEGRWAKLAGVLKG
jgi:hypothetical protein